MWPRTRRPRESAPDVLRDVTVVIKTFERPDCLRRLLTSILRFYPGIRIVVVDDSAEPLDPVPEGITRYVYGPFNSLGVCVGRNVGLRHVETEHVLFCDDDIVFKRRTDLGKLVRALRTTRFGLASGRWVEYEHRSGTWIRLGTHRWAGTLDVADGVLVHERGATRGSVDGLPVIDIGPLNFFMARRAALGEEPWDPALNLAEHTDFYLTLKQRGVLCTVVPDVSFYHYPYQPPGYAEFRYDRDDKREVFLRKHGLRDKRYSGPPPHRRTDRVIHYYRSATVSFVRRCARVPGRLVREGRLRSSTSLADPGDSS